jgi:glycerol-3-phosphate dehydrogenase (NAD(P)+)
MQQVSVLGAGSFGTVLANIASSHVKCVNWWMRDDKQVSEIQKTKQNKRYLPDYPLADNIYPSTDLATSVKGSELIIIAIPSSGYRKLIKQLVEHIAQDAIIISATKGIDIISFQTMSQLLSTQLQNSGLTNKIGVLSGPNLAKEIAGKHLTASVIASRNTSVFHAATTCLRSDFFRLYSNTDVLGVELCGALKNIYAIAAGLMDALDMGDNSKSMFLTRSLAEMSRFCVPLGADPMTFLGLAGIGDLMATCASSLSRNYSVGYSLGKGLNLNEILAQMNQVAEGVNTLAAVHKQAQLSNIAMPLASGLAHIIFDKASVNTFADALMQTEHQDDVEYSFTATEKKPN